MNRENNEKFIVFVTTLASAGLVIENFLMGWEFWVPPVVIAGVISLWLVSVSGKIDRSVREIFYFGYACLLLFYHGVHETSFFDTAIAVILVMVTFSILDIIYMMNILLLEYALLKFIQMSDLAGGQGIVYDRLNISRILLHISIVLLVYYIIIKVINTRLENAERDRIKDERLNSYESDMEDFLSNISHEFRTPVNVVNGISDLLIKKGIGADAEAVKKAGLKLAYQIEDIQDYTECKRNSVFLEEENYMGTSLINDVVTSFRLIDNNKDLELVVDLDPKVPTMMYGDIRKLHKIFRHLLENAVKFTKKGGIYVRMYTEKCENSVNLCIEMTDTGIGMDRSTTESLAEGMYQFDKKRNRSTGGIGLGLFIVYGFVHKMGGCVKIESEKNVGTTIRITVPQKVISDTNCLMISGSHQGDVLFHVRSDKYRVPKVREFYRDMAANLAEGIKVRLYPAETTDDVEHLREKLDVRYIFMGQEEYEAASGYFDELAGSDIVVAVSASAGFRANPGSAVLVMPKPLYAYPVIKVLNEGKDAKDLEYTENLEKPVFKDIRALVVDDEPMNLVVASGMLMEYEMSVDTADSGFEAIKKFRKGGYDVVFMDHMMPEMDGVEAMKEIKAAASENGKSIIVIALTANAVSGAKEMFMKEGFDGFISKPIFTPDLERVMQRVLDKAGLAGR
ncbi:MAG: response regulator [Lachnospiraceae bacterium]|nr:response regulator [Lachnospiraceae bacterium]